MAVGRCVTAGLRAHGRCNNRPAGHKQGSERTQSWIKDRGKVKPALMVVRVILNDAQKKLWLFDVKVVSLLSYNAA